MSPNLPSKLDSSHNPPGIILDTWTPFETAGSEPGPCIQLLIVASHVPTSLARRSCSGVGLGIGGPSWPRTGPPEPQSTRHATSNARLRIVALIFVLQKGKGENHGTRVVSTERGHLSSKISRRIGTSPRSRDYSLKPDPQRVGEHLLPYDLHLSGNLHWSIGPTFHP